MSAVIRVNDLSKRYRLGQLGRQSFLRDWKNRLLRRPEPDDSPENFWALRNLTFEVQQGEVLAIIGHNGAGKSTLLKILSFITKPTSGSVKLKGRVASLLEVGSGFHQELSGRDNIFLNGAILGMSRREISAKFNDILDFAEVGDFIDTPVKRYSSGMRVRLAFAVAAHLEPEILIVDEVLAVGDAAFQQRCIGRMGEVSRSGRTILFVSHNAAAVENLCSRGIVLERGKVAFDGTQTAALQHYARQSVAAGSGLTGHARSGTGEVVVSRVELREGSGTEIHAVRSGAPLEIWLHFERRSFAEFTRLCADVVFTTPHGESVFSHSNWFTGDSLNPLPAKGALVCRLPALNLAAGTYRIDFGLYPHRRRHTPLDAVKAAREVTILETDFFGGGKLPPPNEGHHLVPGCWRVEGAVSSV